VLVRAAVNENRVREISSILLCNAVISETVQNATKVILLFTDTKSNRPFHLASVQ